MGATVSRIRRDQTRTVDVNSQHTDEGCKDSPRHLYRCLETPDTTKPHIMTFVTSSDSDSNDGSGSHVICERKSPRGLMGMRSQRKINPSVYSEFNVVPSHLSGHESDSSFDSLSIDIDNDKSYGRESDNPSVLTIRSVDKVSPRSRNSTKEEDCDKPESEKLDLIRSLSDRQMKLDKGQHTLHRVHLSVSSDQSNDINNIFTDVRPSSVTEHVTITRDMPAIDLPSVGDNNQMSEVEDILDLQVPVAVIAENASGGEKDVIGRKNKCGGAGSRSDERIELLRSRVHESEENLLRELRSEGIVHVHDLASKRQEKSRNILMELRDIGLVTTADGSKSYPRGDEGSGLQRKCFRHPARLESMDGTSDDAEPRHDEADMLLLDIDSDVKRTDEEYLTENPKKKPHKITFGDEPNSLKPAPVSSGDECAPHIFSETDSLISRARTERVIYDLELL